MKILVNRQRMQIQIKMTRNSISQRKPLLAFWHMAFPHVMAKWKEKKMLFRVAVTTEVLHFGGVVLRQSSQVRLFVGFCFLSRPAVVWK